MNPIKNLLESDPSAATEQKIYTTGYEGREVTFLPGLLKHLDAVLIDIRFTPLERPIQWRKDYLKLLLKGRYLHVPNLGNRAPESSGKVSIQNLALGIKVITELKVNVLLMCECKTEESCHRRVINEELKGQGIRVEELTDWCIES